MAVGFLLALALALSLCINQTYSALVGPWFAFFGVATGLLLKSPPRKDIFILLWIMAVFLSGFLLHPVAGGATFTIVLLTGPIIALLVKDLRPLIFPAALVAIYAMNLVAQHFFLPDDRFLFGRRSAWPLVDPNAAAAIMNVGLICSIGLWTKMQANLFKHEISWKRIGVMLLVCLFAFALYCTGSRGGFLCAGASLGIMGAVICPKLRYLIFTMGAIATASVFLIQGAKDSLLTRVPIWQATYRIIEEAPIQYKLLGTGIGSFPYYYDQARTENETHGAFAHNDILQMAMEMGIPAACVFIILVLAIALKTTRENIIPAAALFAVFLHSMVTFQFYLPPVQILCGLCLGWWFYLRPMRI